MSQTTRHFINLENQFGAHNYHPLNVVLTKGRGVWVYDVEGKKYLDMLSSYSALNQGHNHPKIVKAATNQLKKLTLTSRAFYNDQLGPFLKKICQLTKKQKALPMNSGAEAVETAIKAARKWGYVKKGVKPDKAEIIVCEGNFHGRTTTIVGFSSEQQYKNGFGPFTPGFVMVKYGDISALKKAINKNTVGFLVEPIQGEAGVIIPPSNYLKEAAKICKKNKILLIADEIQTGLGRTGTVFACDHEGVTPDIYIIGKALSGGISPVSVIAADKKIMDVFNPGDHGSTFGGNPFAAAVGQAALAVLIDEQLPQNAKKMGEYFMDKLRKLNSPHIKEVRGRGLLIGVELTKKAGKARPFCEKLRDSGILAKETHDTVIRFAPPLIITRDDIDWALERIEPVLAQAA